MPRTGPPAADIQAALTVIGRRQAIGTVSRTAIGVGVPDLMRTFPFSPRKTESFDPFRAFGLAYGIETRATGRNF
jgi:hypothetical protein